MIEEWRDIKGFDGYEVSSLGRVRSHWRGRPKVLKLKAHKQGYLEIGLYDAPRRDGGKQRYQLVHRLVLAAFDRAPNEGEVCRHLNGDPSDNRLDNLCWGTQSDNWMDAFHHGTAKASLTIEEVREIRERYIKGNGRAQDGNAAELAAEFGVEPYTITRTAAGKAYAWVDEVAP